MTCLACGAENRAGRRFCGKCGAPLTVVCASCGFDNEPADAFCGGCGVALAEPVPAPPLVREPVRADGPERAAAAPLAVSQSPPGRPAAAPADGERRQVTVLFADMKGYTALCEKLGEEAVYRLMDDVYQAMIGVVDEAGGTVQELTGDGILALFGVPRALEDGPVRACGAALAIQGRMRDISARVEAAHGVAASVRIGINTGPVVVASVGSDVRVELKAIGDTVNLAARLEALAEPGTVLLSEATHALVADLVEAVDLGWRPIRGKSAAQRTYRLTRLREGTDRFEVSRRRGLTPLVGRRGELEALGRAWRETRGGSWRVVHVVGEPGIGKTRIVHELRERLEREGGVVLAGHCSAAGERMAFLPFIEVLRQGFRVSAEDDPDAVTRKISQGLGSSGSRSPGRCRIS